MDRPPNFPQADFWTMWPLYTFRLAPEQGTFFLDTQHQRIRSILREGILPETTSSPLGVRLFTGQIQVDLIAQNGDPVGLFCLGSIVS